MWEIHGNSGILWQHQESWASEDRFYTEVLFTLNLKVSQEIQKLPIEKGGESIHCIPTHAS
jgi:hypothetical protein